MRQEIALRPDVDRQLAAEQVAHRRRGAAVGDMRQRALRAALEQRADEMRRRARPRRAVAGQRAAARAHPADQIGQRAHRRRHRRADPKREAQAGQRRHRHRIGRAVAELRVQMRVQRHHRHRRQQQRRAVGRRLHQLLDRMAATTADPRLDAHALAQPGREMAADLVDGTAGRKAQQQPRRGGLRARRQRGDPGQQRAAQHEMASGGHGRTLSGESGKQGRTDPPD